MREGHAGGGGGSRRLEVAPAGSLDRMERGREDVRRAREGEEKEEERKNRELRNRREYSKGALFLKRKESFKVLSRS